MARSPQPDAKPGQKVPERTAAERAKAYIAKISEPAANSANVKLKVTLYLPRATAVALMVQAIEQDKNFETLLRDILAQAASK